VKLDRTTWFPFEVQFLTFLQADWALKEHLVYENPAKYPASLHERLRELSSILHDISVSFDDLRDQIAGIG
jgi:ppGpp synthetase/RelA/SpoT-type nucleotidyltranferase